MKYRLCKEEISCLALFHLSFFYFMLQPFGLVLIIQIYEIILSSIFSVVHANTA